MCGRVRLDNDYSEIKIRLKFAPDAPAPNYEADYNKPPTMPMLVAMRSVDEDAAKYIQKLPNAEQQHEEWQAAVEAMLLVVKHNGPTMMARIGVMRALNRHHVRESNPNQKEPRWGRRKLARDR
jgi:hypothetical protein